MSGRASSARGSGRAGTGEPAAYPLLLALAVALAVSIRLAYVLSLRATPWFANLSVDPEYYERWAAEIAGGRWLGTGVFYMDPLYPYVLAVLHRTLGPSLLLPRLLNVGLAGLTSLLVARLGRALGGRATAVLAAFLFAFYEPDVFHTGEIDKTSLSVFLVAASLAVLLRRDVASRLGAGALLGLAALTRANLLAFVPAVAVLDLVDGPAGESRRRRVAAAAALVAGVVLVLAPVAARNYVVSGEHVLTTAQAGQNFYIGNCPENPQGGYGTLPFVRGTPPYEQIDFHAEAERRTGRALGPTETSRFWFGEALRHIRAEPASALVVTGRKLALFWNDFEIPDTTDQYLLERYSWVLRLPLPGFGVVMPLGLLGLALSLGRPAGRRLALFTVVYCVTTAAFFIMARYRIQVVVALVPGAAFAVTELAAFARRRRWRPLAAAGVAVVALAAFAYHQVDVFGRDSEPFVQAELHRVGLVHARAGDDATALRAHLEAAARCQRYCAQAVDDVVTFYRARGRDDEAAAFLRRFLAAHPGHRGALDHLERMSPASGSPRADP